MFDCRYSYLETGSLISIKKNVKDILIPSEEMRIQVYPMDYEEFCDATGSNYELLHEIYNCGTAIGQATNRKLMRDLRIYMAVGGMPQAVEAYVDGKNFSEIDMVKRQIVSLYEEDFKKIDDSGRISALYHSIPAQLAKDTRKYRITTAIGKKNNTKIKSSGTGKHESIKEFSKKFSQNVNKVYLIPQKDVGREENLLLKPFYFIPFLI